MKLHLVGGFLGSGKTTAILQAAKSLLGRGSKVGIITNDQGRYLVDTAFFRLADIPAVEVTGGCFCCNYYDLDARLDELIARFQPEAVFAESVGSCADIVATVIKPLLQLRPGNEPPASFSVFADSRLLRLRLLGELLPFSDEVVYLFDKQIEEAGLLVVNKIDLLPAARRDELKNLVRDHLPGKPALYQNSLAPGGGEEWLAQIEGGELPLPEKALAIDYARYGAGEARLAWLDQEIRLQAPGGGEDLQRLLSDLAAAIRRRGAGVGHLKLWIEAGPVQLKLSLPAIEQPGWLDALSAVPPGAVRLLVNARLEMGAEELHTLLEGVLRGSGLAWKADRTAFFHPSQPRPTHRMA